MEFLGTCLRMESKPQFGLHHWYVFGLNIFEYNNVRLPVELRPDVMFLMELTSNIDCAVHVSSLALKDRVDSLEEMFGPEDGPTPYFRSHTGYHDHFYDLNEWRSWDACVFSRVTSLFWQALLREEGDLEQMMGSHGFAFYVAPRSSSTEGLEKLLTSPFPGEAEWLRAMCELYALVVTVGHDGQFLHCYTADAENLTLLTPFLRNATHAMEQSEWFQQHKSALAWDETSCCLILTS